MPVNKNYLPSRIGLHYFSDTVHYRVDDLKFWITEFKKLNLGWLVLKSDSDRAIPEFFLRSLIQENITPILEFNLPVNHSINSKELRILLQVYARWGVRYVIFYDRPNSKESWPASSWTQQDLVERFLDQYIPLARQALEEGLIPVFPPLQPGGSYWDTAFLRSCLTNLQRRKQEIILKNLVLAAYAHSNNKDLNWGMGGPQHWPQTKPYITPEGSQDQQGFRIYDWYQAISLAVLQKEVPIILLQSGLPAFPESIIVSDDLIKKTWLNEKDILEALVSHKMLKEDVENNIEPIPTQILSCNFWLLADENQAQSNPFSWYQDLKPAAPLVFDCMEQCLKIDPVKSTPTTIESTNNHPIRHYILLPTYEWGVSDWHLEVIQPFIKKHKATTGYSTQEAALSARVTVIGNPQSIPEETLEALRQKGCFVERISGDGTSIATQLVER
jgi:hypothetical protein